MNGPENAITFLFAMYYFVIYVKSMWFICTVCMCTFNTLPIYLEWFSVLPFYFLDVMETPGLSFSGLLLQWE